MIGHTLGPYHITTQIAQGGQATLYKATHTVLGRETALKVLHPYLTTDPDFVQKFEAESKILARFKHPNIVAVHDAGTSQGHYWIAMEWLAGQTVEALIAQQGQLPVDLVVRIADQVAAALEYAHTQNLIHRDIKPGNIMLMPDGAVKVLDFGIAAIIAAGQRAMTRIGTVEYMSYEQFIGQADQRSDLYSLGATLYEMLTGQLPPPLAADPLTPPRQINSAISTGLENFLYRVLARAPDGRPQSTIALRQELQLALAESVVQTPTTPRCFHCQANIRMGAKFCQKCGQPLIQKVKIEKGQLKIKISALFTQETDFKPQFSWSADGEWLACTSKLSIQYAIMAIGLKSIEQRNTLLSQEIIKGIEPDKVKPDEIRFQWAPQGSKIALSWHQKHPDTPLSDSYPKIWIREVATGNLEQITFSPGEHFNPVWAPDSSKIFFETIINSGRIIDIYSKQEFTSTRAGRTFHWLSNGLEYAGIGSGSVDIYSLDGVCNRTISYEEPYGLESNTRHADWSPHDKVAFGFFFYGVNLDKKDVTFPTSEDRKVVLVVDLHHDTIQKLCPAVEGYGGSDPYWSPNGEFLLVCSRHRDIDWTDTSSVTLFNLNQHNQQQVLTNAKGAGTIYWSPDSTRFLFTRDDAIWTVNVDDTGLQRLTEGYAPLWSPDGRYIAFLRSPQQQVYELWVMQVETK